MTTRLTLQTQTNLLQQSNVEVPNDAYITCSNTANQNFPAYVDTKIIWDTTILNYRITRTGSDFVVPETGWYMISLYMWWAGNPTVYYGLNQTTSDIPDFPNTDLQRANTVIFTYIAGNIPFGIFAFPTVAVTNVAIYGRPYCKIKKIR